jgi:hypothetical protein
MSDYDFPQRRNKKKDKRKDRKKHPYKHGGIQRSLTLTKK